MGPEAFAYPYRALDRRLVQVERISARISQLGAVGMDDAADRGVTEPEGAAAGVQSLRSMSPSTTVPSAAMTVLRPLAGSDEPTMVPWAVRFPRIRDPARRTLPWTETPAPRVRSDRSSAFVPGRGQCGLRCAAPEVPPMAMLLASLMDRSTPPVIRQLPSRVISPPTDIRAARTAWAVLVLPGTSRRRCVMRGRLEDRVPYQQLAGNACAQQVNPAPDDSRAPRGIGNEEQAAADCRIVQADGCARRRLDLGASQVQGAADLRAEPSFMAPDAVNPLASRAAPPVII